METQYPVIQLNSPLEIVSYLHYRLGFWPEDSVCLLGITQQDRIQRADVVARIDLVDIMNRPLCSELIEQVTARGCRSIVVSIFSQSRPWSDINHLMNPVNSWLQHWRAAGVEPLEVIAHCGEYIAAVEHIQGQWQPVEPRVHWEQFKESRTAATMVLAGFSPVSKRSDLAAPDFGTHPLSHIPIGMPAAQRQTPWRWDLLAPLWREAMLSVRRGLPSNDDWDEWVPHLLNGLADGSIRDHILLNVVKVRDRKNQNITELAREVLLPHGPAPDLTLHADTRLVLERLLPFADADHAAIIYGMISWLSWLIGDGARADVVSNQALTVDSQQPLAQLVQRALRAGMAPGWLAKEMPH